MNHHKQYQALFVACAAWALAASPALAADAVIASPDSRTTLRIAEDGATFSVTRRGETVIAASPLGLELDGEFTRELRRSVRTVRSGDVLTLRLAVAGGAAVILEPLARGAAGTAP